MSRKIFKIAARFLCERLDCGWNQRPQGVYAIFPVIDPAFMPGNLSLGCSRHILAILCAAYSETFSRADATDYVAIVYARLRLGKANHSGPRGVYFQIFADGRV